MKKIIILIFGLFVMLQATTVFAVKPTPTENHPVLEEMLEEEQLTKKELKEQARLEKKMEKLEKKMAKYEEKAQKRGVVDEPQFRLGLLLLIVAIGCGIIAALGILPGLFGFVGGIIGLVGIIFLILGILNS